MWVNMIGQTTLPPTAPIPLDQPAPWIPSGQPNPEPFSLSVVIFITIFLLVSCICGFFTLRIAKQRNKEGLYWFFIGVLPLVNLFSCLYLLSLPDQILLQKIKLLEDKQKGNYQDS